MFDNEIGHGSQPKSNTLHLIDQVDVLPVALVDGECDLLKHGAAEEAIAPRYSRGWPDRPRMKPEAVEEEGGIAIRNRDASACVEAAREAVEGSGQPVAGQDDVGIHEGDVVSARCRDASSPRGP